jgi:hypothetical protein
MITGVRWYAGRDCVGIVQVVQDHQKDQYRQTGEADFKYYIGVGKGDVEKEDTQYVVDYGMPFDKVAGDALFGV